MIRVCGIDPGATTGWAILDVGARLATPVAIGDCRTPLGEPLLASAADIFRALAVHQPELVVIECVIKVHGSKWMGTSFAQGLASSNWVGGELTGLLRGAGHEVLLVANDVWRDALVGKRWATDAEVKKMVLTRCPTWPARSNEHERDGGGCALWAGLRPEHARGAEA